MRDVSRNRVKYQYSRPLALVRMSKFNYLIITLTNTHITSQ